MSDGGTGGAVGSLRMVVIDVNDLQKSGEFWAALLGGTMGRVNPPYLSVVPPEGRPTVLLQKVPEPKRGKNRVHIDLAVDDLDSASRKAEALGARRLDRNAAGRPEFIVMADPEGNEFCLVKYLR